MNSSLNNGTSDIHNGWAPQPEGRGTLSILWGCLFTNFLCSWAVLCLNVSNPSDGMVTLMSRKLLWMLCIIVGPEIALALALGQYCSARRSVADFKSLEKTEWTLEHAFFADMGGITLSAPTWCSEQVAVPETMTFPVNAKQLHYLVEHQYLDFPRITTDTIRDKSKNDHLARFLISAQALWFVVQCVGRLAQRLPLTTLELSTSSVVLSSLPMFWCWFRKPVDVAQPIRLAMATPISTVLLQAGKVAARPYDRTPLDFVHAGDWNFDVYYSLGMEIATRLLNLKTTRPLDRFTTADFPRPEIWAKIVLVAFELTFTAIHLAGWNFHFPTRIERTCWRCSCCILAGCYVYYWLMDSYISYTRRRAKEFALRVQESGDISDAPDEKLFGMYSMKKLAPIETKEVPPGIWETAAHARFKTMPRSSAITWLLPLGCSIIVMARLYTVVEVFAGLRSVPKAIYDDVEWANFIPHF